jgi:hypothetical protein
MPARATLRGGLRASGGGGGLRGLLVAAEVALALVLLAGGAVLVRDLVRRQRLDLGYDPRGLLTASVSLATEADAQARASKLEGILAALAARPGVESVGATCIFPSSSGNFVTPVLAADDAPDAAPRLIASPRAAREVRASSPPPSAGRRRAAGTRAARGPATRRGPTAGWARCR